MTRTYDRHDAAFALVSAFVLLSADGERRGTIAFKHPKDGAGRLYCYLHVLGSEMVMGFASGGGYDKCSAAFIAAAEKLQPKPDEPSNTFVVEANKVIAACKAVQDDGKRWNDSLRDLGARVLQAV